MDYRPLFWGCNVNGYLGLINVKPQTANINANWLTLYSNSASSKFSHNTEKQM